MNKLYNATFQKKCLRSLSYALSFGLICAFPSCKTMQPVNQSDIRKSMVKALEWQEANPIQEKKPNDWTNGAYYVGVVKAHETTKNKKYYNALVKRAERTEWKPADRFFHADDLVIGYPYLYLKINGAPNADLAPTEKIIDEHLNKPHAWKDGTDAAPEKKILWWWCDALFMTPPLLTYYADYKNDNSYIDKMHEYYMQTYNLLYDKEEGLFARDTRYQWTGVASDRKEANGKKIFWSRGNGWVIAGLALTLERMPADYKHRKFYETLFVDMAKRIKDLQPQDGLWRTSLLSPESYPHGEASGSGFFVYALTWGVNNGLLDDATFKPVILKGWNALRQVQHGNGKIGWVQNIGADPQPANFDSWQNYGTGAYLLAGSEMLKLK
jgi:unsaturated rhamnogalacturonyl hydrolase